MWQNLLTNPPGCPVGSLTKPARPRLRSAFGGGAGKSEARGRHLSRLGLWHGAGGELVLCVAESELSTFVRLACCTRFFFKFRHRKIFSRCRLWVGCALGLEIWVTLMNLFINELSGKSHKRYCARPNHLWVHRKCLLGGPGPHLSGPTLLWFHPGRKNPLFWPLGAGIPQGKMVSQD